jgi:hypothetical protein
MRRRQRIEPTHEWDQLVLLFEWPEQEEYVRWPRDSFEGCAVVLAVAYWGRGKTGKG